MSEPIKFVSDGDESVSIMYMGKELFTMDHDYHGWSGMSEIEDAVEAVANALGVPVEHE